MAGISTRNLKWLTTVLVIIPICLMLIGPWVLRRTKNVSRITYANRIGGYAFVLAVTAIGAGIGAYAILRREQETYREKALQNMKDLIEATNLDRLAKLAAAKELAEAPSGTKETLSHGSTSPDSGGADRDGEDSDEAGNA
jgi:hypothetical protein